MRAHSLAVSVFVMSLFSTWRALLTRWTLGFLLKRAYTRERFEEMARQSRFGRCEIAATGIGFEVRLRKG